LREAITIHRALNPEERKVETVEEFVAEALEGHYDRLDAAYYACEPEVVELLERFLHVHLDEFIEWV